MRAAVLRTDVPVHIHLLRDHLDPLCDLVIEALKLVPTATVFLFFGNVVQDLYSRQMLVDGRTSRFLSPGGAYGYCPLLFGRCSLFDVAEHLWTKRFGIPPISWTPSYDPTA